MNIEDGKRAEARHLSLQSAGIFNIIKRALVNQGVMYGNKQIKKKKDFVFISRST